MNVRDKKPFDPKKLDEVYLRNCNSFEKYKDKPVLLWYRILHVLIMEYIQGRDFAGLTERMGQVVSVLHARKQEKHSDRYPNYEYLDRDTYIVLAFAVALPIDDATWALLNDVYAETGADCYVDRILANQFPGRTIAKRDTWEETAPRNAKFLAPLYDAIDAPPKTQSKLIQKYLKNWHKETWREHFLRGSDYECSFVKNTRYYGQFAYEVAAVVMAFNLDDSAFREDIYYPKELVDYHRSRTSTS